MTLWLIELWTAFTCNQIDTESQSLGHFHPDKQIWGSDSETQSGPSLWKETLGPTQINLKYFLEMGKVEITLKFCLGYSDHCRSNTNMKPAKMYFVTYIHVPKRWKGDIILIFNVFISRVRGDLHARTILSFISPLHWPDVKTNQNW